VAAMGDRGSEAGEGFGRGLSDWVGERMPTITAGIAEELQNQKMMTAAFEAGEGIAAGVGRGITENSLQVVTAMDELRWILENGLSPEQLSDIITEKGGEWITLWREGMESKIPGAVEAAHNAGVEALTALANANQLDSPIGSKRTGEIIAELYADGIDENQLLGRLAAEGLGRESLIALGEVAGWDAVAVDQALEWVGGLESKKDAASGVGGDLNDAAKDAVGSTTGWDDAGTRVAKAWAKAFAAHIRRSKKSFNSALADATISYRGYSPPKEGPLSNIDKEAGNIGDAWKGGFIGSILGGIKDAKRALGGYGGLLGGVSGPAMSPVAAGAVSASGGMTVIVNGNVYGGPAGLDQLWREIQARQRQTTRGGLRDVMGG
jgi:hypothetical protein